MSFLLGMYLTGAAFVGCHEWKHRWSGRPAQFDRWKKKVLVTVTASALWPVVVIAKAFI